MTVLLRAESLKELNFRSLMEVYIEGNLERTQDGISLLEVEQDFYAYLKDVFFSQADAVYWILEEDGRYCSALRLETYRDGWLLEAFETAPTQRRKGYGEKLLRQVVALPEYEKIYSHVHKRNIPSLRLHEKCGFRRISEQASYIDGSVNSYACTMMFQKTRS